jgi:hypothetical protein
MSTYKKIVILGALLFSIHAVADGDHAGGKQVAVNQLNDISDSLRSGITGMFEACAKKILGNDGPCTLENMGTTRDPNATHGAKNSCHKNRPSDAVDIGAIECGGARMAPKDEQYMQMAKCLANQEGLDSSPGGMTLNVIYGNGAPDQGNLISDSSGKHDDHIHAMVPGCSYNNGGASSYGYKGKYDSEGRSPASN